MFNSVALKFVFDKVCEKEFVIYLRQGLRKTIWIDQVLELNVDGYVSNANSILAFWNHRNTKILLHTQI